MKRFVDQSYRLAEIMTKDAIIARLQHLPPDGMRSLTMDNGTENTQHQEITATLGTTCFFAHPYSSWERGTNENSNGLVRCSCQGVLALVKSLNNAYHRLNL